MLEGLHRVNWRKYQGAYALKDKLPQYICNLASEEEATRQEARYHAFEEINHQGSIYDVTPHIVPFLIELLTYEFVQDKHEIVCCLFRLSEACSAQFTLGTAIGSRYTQNCFTTYRKIVEGYTVYTNLLFHSSSEIRYAVILLLSTILEFAPITRRLYRKLLSLENKSNTKAEAVYRLGKLTPHDFGWAAAARERYLEIFEQILEQSDDRLVKLAAASAWVTATPFNGFRDEKIAPDSVVNALLDGLIQPLEQPEAYHFEFLPEHAIIGNLVGLGYGELVQILCTPDLPTHHVHYIAREMLDIVFERKEGVHPQQWQSNSIYFRWSPFGGWRHENKTETNIVYRAPITSRNYSPSQPLIERQRRVINAIVNCDKFWKISTYLFSFFYDLPDSRDELRKLANDTL